MKRIAAILAVAFVALSASLKPQESYIEKYCRLAVSEMKRTGVPASITLAQGILESRSGQSMLAVKANNHFGIKCHNDWRGRKIYQDDDARGECFRVYPNADASFKDHSDFLRFRDRYKFLFELDPTDYKGWAAGLSKAGYATDPGYASKLTGIIEEYGLSRFDLGEESVPEAPVRIEKASERVRQTAASEVVSVSLSRTVLERNGVPFVYAVKGDTYEYLARANNLFLKEILSFNDRSQLCELVPGEPVFLARKKQKAARGLDKYVVEGDGESLWSIAQRFAVRESSLRKYNNITEGKVLCEGDTILLGK